MERCPEPSGKASAFLMRGIPADRLAVGRNGADFLSCRGLGHTAGSFPAETPVSIPAVRLIAISFGFAEAIEVTFSSLLLVDDWRDDISETGITQG